MESPRVELESTSLSLDGSLFTGGGAVGALMRSVDWSRTPLGPVSSWPQSLRTAVSICIASRFPILVWWGPQLVKLYNDTYAAILGAKHPRALGAPGREVWPEIWHIIGPMLEGVLQRGESTWSADLMLPLERKGFSEECYFTFSYSPIRDESGGIGGVFSAIAETTERVLSERRLATLGELSARTSAVRGTAADACRTAIAVLAGDSADVPFAAVYLADGDEEARLVASFGVTPGSAAAPNVARSAPRDDELPSPWPVAEVLRQGSTIQIGNLGERVRGLPGEGGPHAPHTALTIPLRRGDRDRPYGVLVAGTSPHLELEERYRGFFDLVAGQIATAISSVRAYEEERRRAEALAELDRAKTIFFSNVSHEFRTPLTLMLGPLEDALDDAAEPLPPGQRSRLTLVQRNGLRLLKLVNSLLDFSRIEAGRVQARYEPVDLAAITADLASSFRAATDRAGLKLIVDCESLGEPVYVDEGMWEKIVLNLLSNAFKFTFNGSIRVSMHRVGNEAELQVSDTGIGIAADALPRIFERFHRVEGARARTHEGSGIGLSLVQELVRLHTGKITVASEPNRGTTFTVRIPLGSAHLPTERVVEGRRQASTRLGAAPFVEEALRWLPGAPTDELPSPALVDEEQATPAATTSAQRARVLIVDDNADMRAYLARLLAPRYEVTAAADGLEALESIRLTPPDLVVSDVMMPRLDGVELLRALREGESTRTMPVILLSARAGEEATLEGLDAGADDYLVKPFSARELLTRVRTHLELSAVRSRAAADREQLISKLETERGRLLELFEQAPAFLAVLKGPSHIFTLTNPAYEELIGFRAALGKPVREALPEIADQGFFATLDRVYATGRPFAASEARVLLRRGDELEESFLDFVYQPMRDADGDVDGILVQGVDVTARVHASRQIEELLQSVQEASEAKSKFLSMMSHELRTPLNAITGFADLLALGVRGPITTEQAEDVRRIRSASQYLLSIINDLLNFSRLEAGRVEFRVQEVSVMTAVTEAQSLIASQLRDKSLAFDVTDCEQLTVRADPERLQQILLNLLTNAIKFTPAGGRLGVRCRREDGVVCIAVSDTGRGIPADQLEHIFDPFVQVDRQQKQAGVGLGLAISRDLARGMSGELSVESTPGVGSTFTLRLPATA